MQKCFCTPKALRPLKTDPIDDHKTPQNPTKPAFQAGSPSTDSIFNKFAGESRSRVDMFPRCSLYGIFTYIYPRHGPSVSKHAIHGASGFVAEVLDPSNSIHPPFQLSYLSEFHKLDNFLLAKKVHFWWMTNQTVSNMSHLSLINPDYSCLIPYLHVDSESGSRFNQKYPLPNFDCRIQRTHIIKADPNKVVPHS